jgi:hypothetical protein
MTGEAPHGVGPCGPQQSRSSRNQSAGPLKVERQTPGLGLQADRFRKRLRLRKGASHFSSLNVAKVLQLPSQRRKEIPTWSQESNKLGTAFGLHSTSAYECFSLAWLIF